MVAQKLNELLEEKVALDVEGIDRLYSNAFQPMLQQGGGVVHFFKGHRGAVVASTTLIVLDEYRAVKTKLFLGIKTYQVFFALFWRFFSRG